MIARSTILAVALCLAPPGAAPGGGPDRPYRVEVRVEAGARRWPETNRWSAEVTDDGGAQLYIIERQVPYDFPYPTLTLGGGGAGVLLDAARGSVEFLSPDGTVNSAWTPFSSPVPSYERIIKCSVGRDLAAFLISEPGAQEVRIVTATLTGAILRETVMPGTTAGEILLAPDGSGILAGATIDAGTISHVTRLLGPDLAPLLDIPLLFSAADFDTSSGRFVIADRHTVIGGALAANATQFQVSLSSGDRIVTAVRCGSKQTIAVTEAVDMSAGRPVFRDADAIRLDAGGRVVEHASLESSSSEPASILRETGDVVVRAGSKTVRIRDFL
jgi:hypothetical protein